MSYPWKMSSVPIWVLAVIAALSMIVNSSAQTQSNDDPWLILASGEKGSINVHTTRQDLIRRYGKSNVFDQEVNLGEGETETGTVVFPKDPQRSIEILWKDQQGNLPASVRITGRGSRWKLVHDISLGTSLRDLERLNGKPFKLSGFGWDYAGTVLSWESGSLAAEFNGGHGRVFLRLDSPSSESVDDKDVAQVEGDKDFTSGHPVMQKLNPTVYQVIVVFPSPTEP